MNSVGTLREQTSSTLSLLSCESRSRPQLTRSVFDIGLRAVICSLVQKDEITPILAANALRPALKAASRPEDGWQVCLDFVTDIVPRILKDPDSYAVKETNKTRNTIRHDYMRIGATAMHFHGTAGGYISLRDSAGYGMLWAYERHRYQGIKLTRKIVGTFACRNTHQIAIAGDNFGEVVYPALVPNSAIDAVMIEYDLQKDPGHRPQCLSRTFLIRSSGDNDNRLLICEDDSLGDTLHRVYDTPEGIGGFKVVGDMCLQNDGAVEVKASERYYRVISTLLDA